MGDCSEIGMTMAGCWTTDLYADQERRVNMSKKMIAVNAGLRNDPEV